MPNISKELPKIAIAQIDVTVGDIAGNSRKIISAWEKASVGGAQLVLFPELSVIGYPPEDLVLTPSFRALVMDAVRDIAKKTTGGAALVLGSVWETERKIQNCAILLDAGEIVHIQPKTILPNYGIFDEKRVFAAGDGVQSINWRGYKIGILVCEDVWNISMPEALGGQGVEAVLVINASPFDVIKVEQRLNVLSAAAKAAKAPVFYANMVGGQDDVVFDGGSLIIDSAGEIISAYPQFAEGVFYSNEQIKPPSLRIEEQIWNAMKLGLADYIRKNGFKSVLLGLSGGIDSAVTAALAADALGAENVFGVLLPSPYTSHESIDDALETAKLLGIKTKTIPITEGMKTFETVLTPTLALPIEGRGDILENWMENPVIGGNLQARLRGITLMALSNALGHLLLSTGNKSEISVGYSTLYGDSCGSYNMLKDVYKTTVYKLANWRNSISPAIPARSISKPPSAELKPNQRDDDQLPPYDILDAILAHHIEGRLGADEITAKGFAPEIVKKVLHLVRISEYKRRQSCPGVKISTMMFGKDRRFPITNKF